MTIVDKCLLMNTTENQLDITSTTLAQSARHTDQSHDSTRQRTSNHTSSTVAYLHNNVRKSSHRRTL